MNAGERGQTDSARLLLGSMPGGGVLRALPGLGAHTPRSFGSQGGLLRAEAATAARLSYDKVYLHIAIYIYIDISHTYRELYTAERLSYDKAHTGLVFPSPPSLLHVPPAVLCRVCSASAACVCVVPAAVGVYALAVPAG